MKNIADLYYKCVEEGETDFAEHLVDLINNKKSEYRPYWTNSDGQLSTGTHYHDVMSADIRGYPWKYGECVNMYKLVQKW